MIEILLEGLLYILFDIIIVPDWLKRPRDKKETSKATQSKWYKVLRFIVFFLFGGLCGIFSLAMTPKSSIQNQTFKVIFLLFISITGGFVSFGVRLSRGKLSNKEYLEHFAYGFIFVFGMAWIRYLRAE